MIKKALFVFLFLLSLESFSDSVLSLKPSSQSGYANFWYDIFSPVSFLLPPHVPKKLIYQTESDFNHIRVYESDDGFRYLIFVPEYGYQSVIDLKNPDVLVSQYAVLSFAGLSALGKEPERVLFIGMGGAIMPTYFRKHYPLAKIDIVDIDNVIPLIAEAYFNFKTDANTKVYIEDGRKFVEDSQDKYDIIFLDVYDAETIPPQFTTPDFFKLLRQRLTSDGVLSLNLANLGSSFVNRVYSSVKEAFPNTCVFLTENQHNYVLISLNDDKRTLEEIKQYSIRLDDRNIFNIKFRDMFQYITTIQD